MLDHPGIRVSVVIPARDAARTIGRAVEAACAQRLDAAFEVIVVDDGSTDETGAMAERAGARVLRHERPRGPADARNTGVAAAAAPLIAFTDADCAPAAGWLAAGVVAAEHADIVQGRVLPEPGVPVGPYDHVLSVERESGLFETANLFVRREWFDRVGGFRPFVDPQDGHFGEDLVFGSAVVRSGGRSAFAGDALVHHAVVPRDAAAWLRERRRLRLFPRITREVPELRRRFFLGVFLSKRTARFDLAAAGVLGAVATRRAWPLLLALPYLRTRPGPAQVAGDAIGLAALVEGSAASKTLVL